LGGYHLRGAPFIPQLHTHINRDRYHKEEIGLLKGLDGVQNNCIEYTCELEAACRKIFRLCRPFSTTHDHILWRLKPIAHLARRVTALLPPTQRCTTSMRCI
jgi:hypothetical protein